MSQLNIELYAPPLSEGSLLIDPSYPSADETFVVKEPFYVAVTHSYIEETLEIPMMVAHVDVKYWKKL
jgi:hypothetical protein